MCQEAVNNVARHAQAESVLIQLGVERGELRIEIEDDGRGFDAGAPRPENDRPHWGLLGIQERAELLGGTVKFDSSPGRGTRVEIRVPLPEDAIVSVPRHAVGEG
jgi:signal transduction histidine kinase